MNKEYQPIPGFEKYGIAIDGEIKHLRTGHIKTPGLNKEGGYYVVNLQDASGKLRRPLVHRLVALTYLPNPDNLPQVNHKDENKLNNHKDNLEWCTAQYNLTYGTRLKRLSSSNAGQPRPHKGTPSTRNKPVIQIDKNTHQIIQAYPHTTAAANALSVGETNIRNVAAHKKYCHTAAGFVWEYIDKNEYEKYLNQQIDLQNLKEAII